MTAIKYYQQLSDPLRITDGKENSLHFQSRRYWDFCRYRRWRRLLAFEHQDPKRKQNAI